MAKSAHWKAYFNVTMFFAGFGLAAVLFAPFKFHLDYAGVVAAALITGGAIFGARLQERRRMEKSKIKLTKQVASLGEVVVWPHRRFWRADSGRLRVHGHGPEPSAETIQLWERIKSNLEPLTEAAESALFGLAAVRYKEIGVTLKPSRISFLDQGAFRVGFDAGGFPEKLTVWPSAAFSSKFELLSASWGTDAEAE